jgi:hypothetical protein
MAYRLISRLHGRAAWCLNEGNLVPRCSYRAKTVSSHVQPPSQAREITQSTPLCNDTETLLPPPCGRITLARPTDKDAACRLSPSQLPVIGRGGKTRGKRLAFCLPSRSSPLDRPNQSHFPESCHDASVYLCQRCPVDTLLGSCPVEATSCFVIAYIRHMGGRSFTFTRSKCHSRYCTANQKTGIYTTTYAFETRTRHVSCRARRAAARARARGRSGRLAVLHTSMM